MRYLDDFMSGNDDNMSFQCKDGSYSTTKENCEKYGGGVADPVDGYGYTPEPKIPEPEPTSQADCSQGMFFAPSYTETLAIKCQAPPCGTREVRIPAMCKFPTSQNDCPSGTKYVAGKSYVGCPPGWPKELGCMPSQQYEPGMCVGTPVITTPTEKIGGKLAPSSVQNALQSLMDKNWLLPAIAIGVGVYLITRKS